jgi:hypothetical protein
VGLSVNVEITMEIAGLESGPSPGGGVRFGSSLQGRSFFGVCRRIPGRLVYVRDVGGERRSVGWVAIDDEDGLLAKVLDLLIWVSIGKFSGRDERD